MAEIGRLAFTVIGSFFGPWGTLIGSYLGSVLFPAEPTKGPRISELTVQHSTIGAPISIYYGTAVGAGNVIWTGGLQPHEHTSGGGKKGGGQTNTTYSASFAIGICEGTISGIRRIWADADLIYDTSDDATLTERLEQQGGLTASIADTIASIRALSAQLNFELYLGDEDQLPDPTIESYEGVGVTPPFRGLAYIVFPDFALEKFGNRIPNFRFEVYTGTPTECGLYSAGNLYPWIEGGRDPRHPSNVHQFFYDTVPYDTFTEALSAASSDVGRPLDSNIYAWTRAGQSGNSVCQGTTSGDFVRLRLNVNIATGNIDCALTGGSCPDFDSRWGVHDLVWAGGGGAGSGLEFRYLTGEAPEDFYPYSGWSNFDGCSSPAGGLEHLADIAIGIERTLLPPSPCTFGEPLVGAPGYCVINGQITQGITWTQVSGSFHVLRAYGDNGVSVQSYPLGPAVISTDPNYNDEDYWTAAYDAAVLAGDIGAGLTYGVDYPEFQSFAFFSECETVDTACVPMATIVTDICRRAGLRTDTASQIDVSDLTTCVHGYIIGRQMSARDALGPLRMFGLWDAVESDALLKFVERGHALVRSLTADDMGAHENGSEAPTLVEVSRVQEKELPRRVRLHFPNFKHDHEASEQSASRLNTEAIDEMDVDLAVSMDPDSAKQLAEIMLYEAHVARNSYRFTLDNDQLELEPTDCIEIPVDGQTERVRIVAVNYKIGGILEVDAVRDDDGAYVSTAVATPAQPSGGGGSGGGPVCPSGVVLLDIPRQNEADVDAGYYAAIYSLCADYWSCAELYRSDDGGLTYQRVARTDLETTVGEILAIGGDTSDTSADDVITVNLFEGTLSSVTAEQIAAGQNKAAIGLDGRWVIIQFQTATLDTSTQWTLTDITWGLDDTSPLIGTTVEGDTFVLLTDTGLIRIPEEADAIGVEKQFKVVSCGESIDSVTPFSFTTWGLSYRRLCPSTVLSATLTSPPSGSVDGDSYLLPNDTSLTDEWAGHGGEIATWTDEIGNWRYCTPVPGTVIHIQGVDSSDPGDDVISGGDGTYTPSPWQRPIEWFDEGTSLAAPGAIREVDITGSGATASLDTSGRLHIDVTGGTDLSSILTTDGDIFVRIAGVVDRLGVGADGRVLVTSGGLPTWTPISAVSGTMTFQGSATVTGAAATNLTISGLDLDAYGVIYLEVLADNSAGSTADFSLTFNSDTTQTNYYNERISSTAAVGGNLGGNNGTFASPTTTQSVTMQAWMRRNFDGFVRTQFIATRGTAAARTINYGWHFYETSVNVTSITVHSSVASALSIGTKINVWAISTI